LFNLEVPTNICPSADAFSVALVGALVGVAGAFLLTYVRDIYLHSKHFKQRQRRDIVQRQLEKLYSPLYQYVKRSEYLLNESIISFSHDSKNDGLDAREKVVFDSVIENYMYLAEDDLMALLPRIHGPAYYKVTDEKIAQKVAALVVSGYEKLRKEYYDLGK
jgi:hypothetical protein